MAHQSNHQTPRFFFGGSFEWHAAALRRRRLPPRCHRPFVSTLAFVRKFRRFSMFFQRENGKCMQFQDIGATTSVLQEHDPCQVNSSCWKIGSFFFRAEWWTWSCFFDAKGKSVPKKYSPTLGGNFHGDESHEIESVKRSPSKQIQLDQEQGKIVPETNGGVAKKSCRNLSRFVGKDIYTSEVKRLLKR